MVNVVSKRFLLGLKSKSNKKPIVTDLSEGKVNKQYRVTEIRAYDKEMESFLFSLGCYEGEVITLISILGETYVINVKEARYSIDKELAKAIKVEVL